MHPIAERERDFLQRRWVLVAFVLVAAIPLLWPPIPPLVDLLGHMGRYRIETAGGMSPPLARAFDFQWALVGNLGVDLLIVPMAKLFGVELGTKLIVLTIPPLTVAGMLWLAREAHGRVPATALFALPLAYSYPFHFGFINFSLCVALVFHALALWLYLARTGRLRGRFWLFAALAWLLWLTHTVGWGLFGLCAGGAELVRRRQAGEGWLAALTGTALGCLPLALPLVAILLFKSDAAEAASGDAFNWPWKLAAVSSVFRDRWEWLDLASAMLLVTGVASLLYGGLRDRRRYFSPMLGAPALLCLAAFMLMPRIVLGSAYADLRLAPFTLAMAVLAIALPPPLGRSRFLVAAGLAFFLLRIGATTASYAQISAIHQSELRALEAVPHGAAVLSMVAMPCQRGWRTDRLEHLPSLAIVRRDAFTNDQWTLDAAQLVSIRKPGVGRFGSDPSQLFYPSGCRPGDIDAKIAIAVFNREAFDYVWGINFAPGTLAAPDLDMIWSNGRSTLYRVVAAPTSGEAGRPASR